MKKEELKTEVDDLLKFTTMLSIFFISVIDILFRYANSTIQEEGSVQLKWVTVIAMLLVCFLVFKIFKNYFSESVLKTSKTLLYIEIFLFIPPMIILSTYLNTITSYFGMYSFNISLLGLIVLPVFILVSLIGLPDLFIKVFKRIKSLKQKPHSNFR